MSYDVLVILALLAAFMAGCYLIRFILNRWNSL